MILIYVHVTHDNMTVLTVVLLVVFLWLEQTKYFCKNSINAILFNIKEKHLQCLQILCETRVATENEPSSSCLGPTDFALCN